MRAFYVLKRDGYPFKPSTMHQPWSLLAARSISGEKSRSFEAVLAREIPSAELFVMAENLQIPAEVLVLWC